MSFTIVSAYFTLTETPFFTEKHPAGWDPRKIRDILSLEIPVCLYIGAPCIHEALFREWEETYPHFRIMPYRVSHTDTWIHTQTEQLKQAGIEIALPEKRNMEKDTYEYLVYMNSRVELMEDAISENIWGTKYFAWMDFNLSGLFHRESTTLDFLRYLFRQSFIPRFITLPGCWPKPTAIDSVASEIMWRFSGGFFIGDIDSILEFAELYRTHLPNFLTTYRRLPWEVNLWAYLEHSCGWSPRWYKGDHNDSIVCGISADVYTLGLTTQIRRKTEYDYPKITHFNPSSASYVFHRGAHILNTRYVSYWMYPNGYYQYPTHDRVIENRNLVSILDAATMYPENYTEMGELYDTAGQVCVPAPHSSRHFTEGLEDIRLYSRGDELRFIATTVNYSPSGKARIAVGQYDYVRKAFLNCRIVEPPTDTWCEKNWIPLPYYNEESRVWDEWFVYKWSPFELGKIDAATGRLNIERRIPTPEIFSKIRGSTTFHDYGDGVHLVGLVHSSEEYSPRHYYHTMVLLDKMTFEPRRWSRPFFFETLSIEFCLGMRVSENREYEFWISRFDRDPAYLVVPMESIPFL